MSNVMHSAGFRLPDGTIVEELFDLRRQIATFAVRYPNGNTETGIESYLLGEKEVKPYDESVLHAGAVLLPGDVGEAREPTALLKDIHAFLVKYIDLPEDYLHLAACYVLFSWVYDAFTVLPYLHLVGDSDSGKSRALMSIGSLCFRVIFANGAITPAPIFRMLERYQGTLVLDEADFGKQSGEWSEIVKILNSGYHTGSPVLRMEKIGGRFEPKAYRVYSPKIIASRRPFADDALTSRCIVVPMRTTRRQDLPLNLPPDFAEETLLLRNQLLAFRLQHLTDLRPEIIYLRNGHEPRLSQVLSPLHQMMPGQDAFLDGLEEKMQKRLHIDRASTLAAEIVQALWTLYDIEDKETPLTMKLITKQVKQQLTDGGEGEDDLKKVTPRRVGSILRRELGLAECIYRIAGQNLSALRWVGDEMEYLKARFGLSSNTSLPSTTPTTSTPESI